MMSAQQLRHGQDRGFTLTELLVVIGILMILMALVIPATNTMMRSMNLSSASTMIVDELNFARQTALSRNRDVEFRIYQMESDGDDEEKHYRAIQCILLKETSLDSEEPLTKVKRLPDSVIISDAPGLSTLLDYGHAKRSGLVHQSAELPGESAPVNYVGFRFRADGATSLKPVTAPEDDVDDVGLWYLTVYLENAEIEEGKDLPANYFTVQVDPVTGRTRSYRP